MFFPFAIKQKLIIDTNAISSGSYVFNHIIGYMDDYNMSLTKKTDTELFYSKNDMWRGLERRDTLKNIRYVIEFTDNKMIVTLESETIMFALIAFLVGLILFLQPVNLPVGLKIAAILGVWSIGWFVKYWLLRIMKNELTPILKRI
jgi:hypothetical protein